MNYRNPTPQMILPPDVRVADNSQNINLVQRLGNMLALDKQKKEDQQNQNRARGLAEALLNGTPEEKQQAKIELAAQEQKNAIDSQVMQARKVTQENQNKMRMLNDPETKSALIELRQLDPNMAAFVMDTMAAEDINRKAQVAEMAKQSLVDYTNIRNIASNDQLGGVDSAKQYVREIKQRYEQQGVDTSKLNQMLDLEGEQFIESAVRQQAMSGAVLKVPEVQKATVLADGAEMYDAQGRLIARNEKDRSGLANESRSLDLRAQELALQREKFQRDGGKLSAAAEKELMKAQDSAQSSNQASSELLSLSQEFENLQGSGATARWSEQLKEFAGTEDATTSVRRKYNQLKNAQVMKSLPPGVASDKDIQIAMSGFLDSTANPQQVASFLRGMAKMESVNAQYQQFKSDWLSENGNTRGMLRAWDDQSQDLQFEGAQTDAQPSASDQELFSKYGIE